MISDAREPALMIDKVERYITIYRDVCMKHITYITDSVSDIELMICHNICGQINVCKLIKSTNILNYFPGFDFWRSKTQIFNALNDKCLPLFGYSTVSE